jgi:hypothetical protein
MNSSMPHLAQSRSAKAWRPAMAGRLAFAQSMAASPATVACAGCATAGHLTLAGHGGVAALRSPVVDPRSRLHLDHL